MHSFQYKRKEICYSLIVFLLPMHGRLKWDMTRKHLVIFDFLFFDESTPSLTRNLAQRLRYDVRITDLKISINLKRAQFNGRWSPAYSYNRSVTSAARPPSLRAALARLVGSGPAARTAGRTGFADFGHPSPESELSSLRVLRRSIM